ncbi:helix-turn-helix domain containing protein [Chryseobacterium sp. X308]|uniref:helix-turn-helix domain-containing protein n=1 Tax=Chryseobacterium sp. X308 TaxID=2884873 RepID=UPI001D14DDB0|nr:helix-turn-helix domain-containing protein [Chryseobacterium sp. X308]MCC3217995.1 helix-turn-helix domain containing protein [Chryseobacterium sp. X308]
MENLKDIHIGALIYELVNEQDITMNRICRFLDLTENEILEMYSKKSLDVEILLKWSKLLKYDFFRLYSHHLILYAPIAGQNKNGVQSKLPKFRKSLYTKEIIDYMMELLENKQKTTKEIINHYGIPKSTLNKWISKYRQ